MKKLALLILVVGSSFALKAGNTPVSIISTKSDIFYFKLKNSFLGATVEVYTLEGELITTDTIMNRKAIVDFYYQQQGTYIIKIKKDGLEEKFIYEKKTLAPNDDSNPLIPITQ